MKKPIFYIILLLLAFWLVNRAYGTLAGFGLVLVVAGVMLWKRRATIFTQLASQAYYVKGDAQKGERLFKKAYNTGLMTPQCKIAYSSFCLRENRFEKGRHLLNEIINSSRTSKEEKLDAKHNLSVLVWKEGNLDEAFEIIEQVHKEKPATNTYATMGVFTLEKAKRDESYQDALDFMLEAYDYNDSDRTIADNLGETYLHMREYEKAKEVYEKLLVTDMVTPMPYYNYGLVLKNMGDTEGARENFEKALRCRFTSVLTVTREMIKQELENLD